jgi:hypothetical protein
MSARIYQPAKSAMQSGEAHTRSWVLDYSPAKSCKIEPLMGWTSSGDQKAQIRLKFLSLEDALAYAKAQGITYTLNAPHKRARKPKAYADNFKTGRLERWTH